jgi:hypothetical protein
MDLHANIWDTVLADSFIQMSTFHDAFPAMLQFPSVGCGAHLVFKHTLIQK